MHHCPQRSVTAPGEALWSHANDRPATRAGWPGFDSRRGNVRPADPRLRRATTNQIPGTAQSRDTADICKPASPGLAHPVFVRIMLAQIFADLLGTTFVDSPRGLPEHFSRFVL